MIWFGSPFAFGYAVTTALTGRWRAIAVIAAVPAGMVSAALLLELLPALGSGN